MERHQPDNWRDADEKAQPSQWAWHVICAFLAGFLAGHIFALAAVLVMDSMGYLR